jgi:hypothetical protein
MRSTSSKQGRTNDRRSVGKAERPLRGPQNDQLHKVLRELTHGSRSKKEVQHFWIVASNQDVDARGFDDFAWNDWGRFDGNRNAQRRLEKWALLGGRPDLFRPVHAYSWQATRLIRTDTGKRYIGIDFPTFRGPRNFIFMRERAADPVQVHARLKSLNASFGGERSYPWFVKNLLRFPQTVAVIEPPEGWPNYFSI